MKRMQWLMVILAGALGVAGCARGGPGASGRPGRKAMVTPVAGLTGKVASVNQRGQFVVLTFDLVQVPEEGERLSLYRGGVKVGEVKVARQQRGQNVVADIVAGEARASDEARRE